MIFFRNFTFNCNVDWIDELEAEGDLICNGNVSGNIFHVGGNVEGKKIACKKLYCNNLKTTYAKIDNLFCKDINCEMLDIEHIDSFDKLNALVMTFNGSMLYNVSANGEDLKIY